jgi:queuine tRNA-ribosyltransferase
MLAATLLTNHNLSFYQTLMQGLRNAIERGELQAFASKFLSDLAEKD